MLHQDMDVLGTTHQLLALAAFGLLVTFSAEIHIGTVGTAPDFHL